MIFDANEYKQFYLSLFKKNPSNKFLASILNKKLEEEKKEVKIWDYDLDSLEKTYFEELLKQANGNKAEVARRAKVQRGKLIGKLKKLGIPQDFGRT